MSLITTCPACGTMFRVVADQLRVSEGWVRCGHCAEVFDATSHMAPGSDPIPPAPEPVPADDAPLPAPAAAAAQATAPDDDPIPSEFAASPLDAPFVFRRSDLAAEADLPGPPAQPCPHHRGAPDSLAPDSIADSEMPGTPVPEVGFVRDARRKAFWSRPTVRVLLVLVLLALAALLAGQFAWHHRDRLAVEQPAVRPVLQAMCEALQCTLQAPRQIDTLAIESSSFNKLRGDAFRLNFTVKNNAPMEVAVPAMELTLTDAQDQPVMRRVLQPSELGAGAVIGAGGDWSASVALAVNGNGNGGNGQAAARIAGYRLLAFYP